MPGVSHIRVVLAVALMGLAAVAVRPAEPREAPALKVTATGDMRIASSAADRAILDAAGMRPGDSTTGSLTLSNRSRAEQQLKLKTVGVTDVPGPGGGELSQHLQLLVERVSGPKTDEVYSGTVAGLAEVDLGMLAASQAQVFRFTATVPEGGPAIDDPYSGSALQVAWRWEATVEDEPEAKIAEPEPVPPVADAPRVEPAAPRETKAAPRADDAQVRSAGEPADAEGPAPGAAGFVRLWAAATPVQRLRASRGPKTSLVVLIRCRPTCSVTADAKVKVGRRWIVLRGRRLGTVGRQSDAVRLSFRLSAAEARTLRRALVKRRRLAVRIGVRAAAPGHGRADRTLALRLQK